MNTNARPPRVQRHAHWPKLHTIASDADATVQLRNRCRLKTGAVEQHRKALATLANRDTSQRHLFSRESKGTVFLSHVLLVGVYVLKFSLLMLTLWLHFKTWSWNVSSLVYLISKLLNFYFPQNVVLEALLKHILFFSPYLSFINKVKNIVKTHATTSKGRVRSREKHS